MVLVGAEGVVESGGIINKVCSVTCFLSPPVHIARWVHMLRFMSVWTTYRFLGCWMLNFLGCLIFLTVGRGGGLKVFLGFCFLSCRLGCGSLSTFSLTACGEETTDRVACWLACVCTPAACGSVNDTLCIGLVGACINEFMVTRRGCGVCSHASRLCM